MLVVHNETSTGATSRSGEIRQAIDRAGHPALLLVDAVSSLASIDLRHDEWGIDVTLAGSQKGMMLPPGLSFNAISDKALAASQHGAAAEIVLGLGADAHVQRLRVLSLHARQRTCCIGLREALRMLKEEGLEQVFARHRRLAAATRAAVTAGVWRSLCRRPDEYSAVVTAVMMPDGARRRRAARTVASSASTCRSAPVSAG